MNQSVNVKSEMSIALTSQQRKDLHHFLQGKITNNDLFEKICPLPLSDLNNDKTINFTKNELREIKDMIYNNSRPVYCENEELIENGDISEIERIRYQNSIEDMFDDPEIMDFVYQDILEKMVDIFDEPQQRKTKGR